MREVDNFALSSIARKVMPVDQKKISLCIIAKDNELDLSACVASAAALADEVVVVDMGSRDNSVEIARELGARVFFLPLPSHLSRIKNFAMDQALYNWVLLLNPQERLVGDLADKDLILQGDADVWLCEVRDLARMNQGVRFEPRLFRQDKVNGYSEQNSGRLEYLPESKVRVFEQLYIAHGFYLPTDRSSVTTIVRNDLDEMVT